MSRRDGPIWPVSVNVVRRVLRLSNLETLHKPEIAIIGRSDPNGWVRYSACIALATYNRYSSPYSLAWALTYAFCEPLSDIEIESIRRGKLLRWTLYASRDAALLRRNELQMGWEEWHKLFSE